LHPSGGIHSKGGSPAQHDRIDPLDGPVRLEQVGFAGSRRPAADVDPRDHWLLEYDRGNPGGQARVISVADEDPGDIGDEVASDHGCCADLVTLPAPEGAFSSEATGWDLPPWGFLSWRVRKMWNLLGAPTLEATL
jgi:hypothetical protein